MCLQRTVSPPKPGWTRSTYRLIVLEGFIYRLFLTLTGCIDHYPL